MQDMFGMDNAEQTRLYQQYFNDLIKFGTEGLRNLNNGCVLPPNTAGSNQVFMPIVPQAMGGSGSDAHAAAGDGQHAGQGAVDALAQV